MSLPWRRKNQGATIPSLSARLWTSPWSARGRGASESVRYRRALAPPLDHQAVIGAGCEQVIAGRTPLILTTFSARLFNLGIALRERIACLGAQRPSGDQNAGR